MSSFKAAEATTTTTVITATVVVTTVINTFTAPCGLNQREPIHCGSEQPIACLLPPKKPLSGIMLLVRDAHPFSNRFLLANQLLIAAAQQRGATKYLSEIADALALGNYPRALFYRLRNLLSSEGEGDIKATGAMQLLTDIGSWEECEDSSTARSVLSDRALLLYAHHSEARDAIQELSDRGDEKDSTAYQNEEIRRCAARNALLLLVQHDMLPRIANWIIKRDPDFQGFFDTSDTIDYYVHPGDH